MEITQTHDTKILSAMVDLLVSSAQGDPPPLNWSTVYFSERRIKDGNETTQTRRDSLQVTAG